MREAGALDLLDKTVPGDKLITAIRRLVSNQLFPSITVAGLA
jgi:hypothetical protein